VHRRVAGRLAPLDFELERAAQEACRAAIGARLLRSAHDCSEGGIAVTLAESCVSGPVPVGAEIELHSEAPLPLALFGEGPSRIVVTVGAEAERHFEQLMREFAVPWRWIGRVGGDRLVIRVAGARAIDLATDRGALAWRTGFERYVG
jgi:phosphoribosylformylglycinamidine (FGAM) synthase-like enzyme